jgi:glutamate racemase
MFDSGHGGLTILRACAAALPDRDFLYYGDHANAPYGERDSAEIVALTEAAVDRLFRRGCRLVVLGCNTAAAVALRTLQQQWLPRRDPSRRILGVLVPTVEAVTGVAWHAPTSTSRDNTRRTIVLFATRRTVASNAYAEEIGKRAPEIDLIQHACAGLVDLIERGAPEHVLRETVRGHVAVALSRLGGRRPDAVMLGCTHYPLVASLFADAVPSGVTVVSQPEIVADSLCHYLARHPGLDDAATGTLRFLTSGDPAEASRFATVYFGREARFERIAR